MKYVNEVNGKNYNVGAKFDNYLDDAMNIKFKNADQYKICDCTKMNCNIRATICGKCYEDPDEMSEKLYLDIASYFGDIFKNLNIEGNVIEEMKAERCCLKLGDEIKLELSTDYIGPSRYWAEKYLDEVDKSQKIGEFLLISRTIGGHVFWPTHQINKQKTINQVKGGRAIYDRIDITLAELKNFYDVVIEKNKNHEFYYYKPLFNAFCRYKWFFECFGTFKNYIYKMKLEDFLVEGEAISLTTSNLKKNRINKLQIGESYKPLKYELYIDNLMILIEQRSEKILAAHSECKK